MREKIYKINVYEIDHAKGTGKLINPCEALIRKKGVGIFSYFEEALTGTPVYHCTTSVATCNLREYVYKNHKTVLGFNVLDIEDENLATKEDVEEYIKEFPDSEITEKIKEYNNLLNLKEENKQVVKELKRAHESGIWRKFI